MKLNCLWILTFLFLIISTSCWHGHSKDDLAGRSLFYKIEGQGQPKLLLLHGMLGSHRYWDGVLPVLSAQHELILVDLLGYGESPKPAIEYTVDQHIAEIEKVTQLIQKDSFQGIIVGHSMGAFLALNYAITHPGKIKKLILINPPMVTDEESLKKAIAETSSRLMVSMTFSRTWGQFVCNIHEMIPSLSYPLIRLFEPQLPPAVAKAAGQHTYNSYRGSFENVLLHQNFYVLLNKVQDIPVLILASTRDEYTKDQALQRLPLRRQLKLVIIDGNHNVLLTDPERISTEILKFIN